MQVEILDIVSEEMGKGIDTIMIGIKDKYHLSIGRKSITKGAFINVKALGVSTREVKELICNRLNEMLISKFSFEVDDIYITFDDKTEWGYKGQFIGK